MPSDLNDLNEPNKQNEPYLFTGIGLLFGISLTQLLREWITFILGILGTLGILGIFLFGICYLEFSLNQLLLEWIPIFLFN